MRLPFQTVDVFTSVRFSGNPLAVVNGAGALSTHQMQCIAREFSYSETSFVRPPRDARHAAEVRIFTPTAEVPFAGHPSIGTAFVLASLPEHRDKDLLIFEERAGLVPVRIVREKTKVVLTQLTAPQRLSIAAQFEPDAVAACLGLSPIDIRTKVHPPLIASVGLPFVIVEVETRHALSRAKPRAEVFAQYLPKDGADAIYIYTREVLPKDGIAIDFSARMFAPSDGLPEDPATGSASGAAMALVSRSDPIPGGLRRMRVAQGVDMGRACVMEVEIDTAGDLQEAVRVGGTSIEVMEGSIML